MLDPGEKVWAEVPVRFNLDWAPTAKPGEHVKGGHTGHGS